MNVSQLYQDKLTDVEGALARIGSEDHIVTGLGAAEAQKLTGQLHTIADRVEDVVVSTCLPMSNDEYFMNPEYEDSFQMEAWFYTPGIRKAHSQGLVSYIPNHLHLAGKKRLAHRDCDVYLGTATPVDDRGFLSIGLSATYEVEMIENADLVILEVNPNVPRTFGDTIIHINQVDQIVETEYDIPELPSQEPSEKDKKIGEYIASLIEDGSTIQLGIGGIPNAVAESLTDKKDLGIHTEMLTDGMVDLYKKGVITGRQKTLFPGKMIATFALGSQKLYNFIDDNPAVNLFRGNWVNDRHVIGRNHKMVSINTTIEVDLTGQCASESIGHKQISGTGGQADTAIGAQNSPEGKSIIALHSTTEVSDGNGGEKTVSKIVPELTSGAAVTLSRNDVDYVVTEYGIASLRGTSIRERVKRLINIAAPKFRKELREKAEEYKIW